MGRMFHGVSNDPGVFDGLWRRIKNARERGEGSRDGRNMQLGMEQQEGRGRLGCGAVGSGGEGFP